MPDTNKESQRKDADLKARRLVVYYGVTAATIAAGLVALYLLHILFTGWGFRPGREAVLLAAWHSLWNRAKRVAIWVCRRLKLSQDEVITQAVRKSAAGIPKTQEREEGLQPIVVSRGLWAFFFPVVATIFALYLGRFLLTSMAPGAWKTIWPITAIFALCCGVAILTWRHVGSPELRVDDDAISTCDTLGFNSRRIEWWQVASFSLQTQINVFGTVENQSVRLMDGTEGQIAEISFSSGTEEERSEKIKRLANYLSLRLTGERFAFVSIAQDTPVQDEPEQTDTIDSDTPLQFQVISDGVRAVMPLWLRLVTSAGLIFMSCLFYFGFQTPSQNKWETVLMSTFTWAMVGATVVGVPLINLTYEKVRVDSRGFMMRGGFFNSKEHVAWSRVVSANVEEKHKNGKLVGRSLLLKDMKGGTLCTTTVGRLKSRDCELMLACIRQKIADSQRLR